MTPEEKNAWILSAINAGYIIPQKDGSIYRRSYASKDGTTVGGDLRLVKYTVQKKSGRVFFNMTWLGITKSVLVNRVIALAFLPNPLNLPQVNHIDGNKENNALYQADGTYQLEWSTGRDNEKHAHNTGLKTGRGSANSNAKLSSADVIAIRESHKSISEIAAERGVARSTIANILARKTWIHL
ncbi:hypothetical protein [Phyllobacterium myrsinacearum]|uniref:HNH nuclease domain-containing protein n=1 Tax=Phyllobacterium myrsinacearum TaxID=28101 RepID=A0A839EM51_9HYPH|nr:hypothetical protein [Phyllobacterium myrsinacearum]MBA8881633.1 hypothetical protein [Phyllobacterium myrsinacearum]